MNTAFTTIWDKDSQIDVRHDNLPSYVDDSGISMTANARTVLEKRYLRKGADGKPIETVAGMFYRVAFIVAQAEKPKDREMWTRSFYEMMSGFYFLPNTPTFTGAGTPLGQLAACFVLPVEDDMGRSPDGIFSTLRNAALIQQTGGGVGFSFSRLRPKGGRVSRSNGQATGPVDFMRVYDKAFSVIAQGGSRRGANMGVLSVHHPDIREFITAKATEGDIANFNISVGVTDVFMEAATRGTDYEIVDPNTGAVVRHEKASEIFNLIAEYAHRNGEPGLLFLDRMNDTNPVPHLYKIEATNPCGEQNLGPYENCCLGSINLANHVNFVDGLGVINWMTLEKTTKIATRFLDNVVTVNNYVPDVPQLKEAAEATRRIGLGIMGLADALIKLRLPYNSEEGVKVASWIMEFIHYESMAESVNLATERGSFRAIKGSVFDPDNFTWSSPYDPQDPGMLSSIAWRGEDDKRCTDEQWEYLIDRIKGSGIRNSTVTTIAPTGTISTVAGLEGYGCEPVFALGYVRHFKDGDKDVELSYVSPLFAEAINQSNMPVEKRQLLLEYVAHNGTLSGANISGIPQEIINAFVVSSDIDYEWHIEMQSALQSFVSNSISKTINMPEESTVDDVRKAYHLAYSRLCNGITIYRTGSRSQVVLETASTKSKMAATEPNPAPSKRQRPSVMTGSTIRKETPTGRAYVTVNEDGGKPFEVFVNVGKAGSEITAVSEAIGRLISMILRMPAPMEQLDRLKWVVEELGGIGGSRPLGFGPKRVLSLADGIAQCLSEYVGGDPVSLDDVIATGTEKRRSPGDICPDCGEATLLHVEGCNKCMNCGYSAC